MTTVLTILVISIALSWIARHVALPFLAARAERLSPQSTYELPDDPPAVTVLVAAKDEQDNIERCVRSLLSQDYPEYEVIALNDRSTDRTPEILDKLAEEYDRLRVIHITELRDGWFGKNNAMRTGVDNARGQLLCFTDADCEFLSPHVLSLAVAYADHRDADLLSVLPVLENHGFLENTIQPVCGAILVMWFSPNKVNDPAQPHAYANGAFMLMSRKAYDQIGGHDVVRTEVNEDMHMARLIKQHHLRLRVVNNQGLYHVRMYTTMQQMWRGWSRIFYGCFGSYTKLLLPLLLLLISTILPHVTLWGSLAAMACGYGHTGTETLALVSGLAVCAQITMIMRFYRLMGVRWTYAFTYPAGALLACGMLINAMTKIAGTTTTWRGTTYRRDQRVDAPQS